MVAAAEVVAAVDVVAAVADVAAAAEAEVKVAAKVLAVADVAAVVEAEVKVVQGKVKVDLQQEVLLQKALNHVQDQQHVQNLEVLKEALPNHKQQAEQNQELLAADLL